MVVYKQVGSFTPNQVHAVNKNNLFHPGLGQIKFGHSVLFSCGNIILPAHFVLLP